MATVGCPPVAGTRNSGPFGVRREQNRAVGLPCAAARDGGIGEDLNGLAVDVETLQLLIGEEANRPTVRRPERKACAFGSCQQSARRRSQRSQPQRSGLLEAEARRHDDLLTIWRDRKLREVSGNAAGKQEVESDFRWSRRLCGTLASPLPRPRPSARPAAPTPLVHRRARSSAMRCPSAVATPPRRRARCVRRRCLASDASDPFRDNARERAARAAALPAAARSSRAIAPGPPRSCLKSLRRRTPCDR